MKLLFPTTETKPSMNRTGNLFSKSLRLAYSRLPFPMAGLLPAQDKPAPAQEQSPLAKDLLELGFSSGSSRQGRGGSGLQAGDSSSSRQGHSMITEADPETGVTVFHHGGTYTLNGDEYVETVEYANENTKDLIKQTLKFTIKIEGDTLTQIGVGNPWTEVWKRAK